MVQLPVLALIMMIPIFILERPGDRRSLGMPRQRQHPPQQKQNA